MTPVLEKLNRYVPLFMAVIAIVALVQFLIYIVHWLSNIPVGGWISDHFLAVKSTVGGAATVSTIIAILGVLRAANRAPIFLARWTWLMDILDRLTNRRLLEQRLEMQDEATFIDAEALAQSLKEKVVGQDAICDDLAAQIRRRLALQQRGKPVGVFLFAGPPGSGKTYTGKVLAAALDRKLIHLDMTQYSSANLAGNVTIRIPKGVCWLG